MFSQRSKKGSDKSKQPVPRRRLPQQDDALGAQAHTRRAGTASSVPDSTPQSETASFRRNQTLSSYRHMAPEESSRHKAHQLVSQRRRLGGIFLIVTLVALALLFLLWQLIAQVTIATSTRQLSTRFNSEPYEQVVNEYLTINPAQRLRLSLNEDALSEYVSAQLPEVERVSLSGSAGVAQATLAITFRTPVAGWQINAKQYYVDSHGVVFEKNYYSAPTVQIVDESGVDPSQSGGAVVGTRLLGFLGRVVAEARGRGYTVTKAVLPLETTRQVDVYFKGIGTQIKYSIDRGAGEQVEDADRSLRHLKKHGITARYIDVRVAGRAAYR